MKSRAIAISLVVAALAAAVALLFVVRPAWLVGDDAGRAAGDVPPDALEPGEAAGISSSDATARARLAARGSAQRAAGRDDLPPPVDFASLDRDLDLHGTVVDGKDEPIAGAEILTVTYPFDRASILDVEHDADAVEGPRARSAKDGSFAIRLRRGAVVSLRASAEGFAILEEPNHHAGERVKVVLRPAVALVIEATAPDGSPAVGAEFSVARRSFTSGMRTVGATGSDGRVRFDGLPAGSSIEIELRKAPWMWKEFEREVHLPAAGELLTRVAFERGRTLTGRVTDAQTQAPIGGARVGMGWWGGRSVETEADGKYALSGWGYSGVREVHAVARGYGAVTTSVGSATVVDFALSRGDEVVGRVVTADGRPLEAVVAAIGSVWHEQEQVTSVAHGTSGPDGRFALAGLRHDLPHVLVVMATGFGRTLLDFDPRADGPGSIDLGDVVVPVGRTIVGRALTSDGKPVADARIEMKGANADRARRRDGKPAMGGGLDYGNDEETRAGADGRFAFVDLAPGTYELDVWTPGMPSRHVTVAVAKDADPAPVDVWFLPGRSVKFTVVDDEGAPVPWACLFVPGGSGAHNTVTALDAQASATLLLPDSVKSITVETWTGTAEEQRRFLSTDREIPVEPGEDEVRCVLKTGARIAGRVVGVDGSPIAQAGVQVWSGAEHTESDTTDEEGRFDVTVPRGGRYSVRFDGRTGLYPNQSDSGLAGAVDDVAAGTTDVVLRARAVAREGRQSVRVVDPDGHAVEGATVVAHWADQTGTSAAVTTDASGLARLVDLPDVRCSFEAKPRSEEGDLVSAYADKSVVPSETTIVVPLRRGLRVRGRVVVPIELRGQPVHVEVTQEDSSRFARTLSPGETTFTFLLDPNRGASGEAAARAGPEGAPTHVARLEHVRLGGAELVLTLEPVK